MTDLGYGAESIKATRTGRTITYRAFKHPVKKSGKCPKCGKRRVRATTLTNTMSPFNTNKETGKPKTAAEIRASLKQQADAWVPDFRCEVCS